MEIVSLMIDCMNGETKRTGNYRLISISVTICCVHHINTTLIITPKIATPGNLSGSHPNNKLFLCPFLKCIDYLLIILKSVPST